MHHHIGVSATLGFVLAGALAAGTVLFLLVSRLGEGTRSRAGRRRR